LARKLDTNFDFFFASDYLELSIIHDKTKREGELYDGAPIFKPGKAALNFDETYIEFRFTVHYAKLNNIEIKHKSAWFSNEKIPIVLDKILREGGEIADISVRASFRNRFVDFFSNSTKQFALTIHYNDETAMSCISSFIVPIPVVENQTDWDSHIKFLEAYLPESIGGFQLNKLFKSQFRISEHTTYEEKMLLSKLL
jgi:hypothetical protein